MLAAATLLAALLVVPAAAAERSGREVVEATCAACHASGAQGAPKIGDDKAWRKRSVASLRSLTQSAIKGIRNMPPHGGDPSVTDLEIARAIAHMVNLSGGKWIEPASLRELAAERTGLQVVQEQCAQCHRAGKNGAPKIGDIAAWTPSLTQGLDIAVRSGIHGHGGMPPRGMRADLTDGEVRNAVLAMITPPRGAAPKDGGGATAGVAPPSNLYRPVGDMEVFLGLVPAETLRLFPEGSPERKMHGGVPRGSGYYHLNVSLADASSKAPIGGAQVEVRVEKLGASGTSSTLEPVTINDAPAYGSYVRLQPRSDYRIVVRVQQPGAATPVEASFTHRTR